MMYLLMNGDVEDFSEVLAHFNDFLKNGVSHGTV